MENDGHVVISLRDIPQGKNLSSQDLERQIPKNSSGVNWDAVNAVIQNLQDRLPELKTGIVRPSPQTPYRDVIKMMDQLKQFKFEGVGLSPLG
jgi:biopolymer transport protein ExbD